MADEDLDECRRFADECRQEAGRVRNAIDKAAWLKLSGDWLRLAQQAMDRRDRLAALGSENPSAAVSTSIAPDDPLG